MGVGVGVGWGGFHWGGGGWGAPISRSDKMASREFGGGADIAGACKRVGGYARSVMPKSLKIDALGALGADFCDFYGFWQRLEF